MPNDLLGSVRRALRVLDYIAEAGGSAAPREIAAATGSNISTIYHVLNTLATDGYAEREDGTGRYRLGRKVAPLGNAFVRSLPVAPNLYPVLRRLSEAVAADAILAVLSGGNVIIAEIVETCKHPRIYPGYTAHLHARAIGKAVLAYCDTDFVRAHFEDCPPQQFTARTLTTLPAIEAELARVRAQGYAEDLDEFVDGVSCVAAPVFDGRGAVYGALAVSLPTLRYRSVCAMAHDAVITAACAATGALADEVRRFASTT